MKNLKKWLIKNGYNFESKKMIGDYEGVFVELDIVENYNIIGHVNINKLLRYLSRTNLKNEYRGHYTSLLIWQ